MLTEPLDLNLVDSSDLFDYLYGFFKRDFIDSKTFVANKIFINPRSWRKDEGKELDFWHLTTKEEKQKIWKNNGWSYESLGRYPDYRRSERIEWVKQVLTNHDHESIKMFLSSRVRREKTNSIVFVGL
ncbi:MAG: hypothetical protein R3E90_02480 [Marinicella sp.]